GSGPAEDIRSRLEVRCRRPGQPADVNPMLRHARRQVEAQLNLSLASVAAHPPAPRKADAVRKVNESVGFNGEGLRFANEVEQVADGVRTDFEQDVAWLTQHPRPKRPRAELAQLLVPDDADLGERPDPPGGDIRAQ